MTTLREAAQQALEALDCIYSPLHVREIDKVGKASNALRAAFEATGKDSLQVEPVAWRYQNSLTDTEYLVWHKGTGGRNWTPLYTAPPKREWQGLTNEEIWSDGSRMDLSEGGIRRFAREIEAKLKEKNT